MEWTLSCLGVFFFACVPFCSLPSSAVRRLLRAERERATQRNKNDWWRWFIGGTKGGNVVSRQQRNNNGWFFFFGFLLSLLVTFLLLLNTCMLFLSRPKQRFLLFAAIIFTFLSCESRSNILCYQTHFSFPVSTKMFATVAELNTHLSTRSYVTGYSLSADDKGTYNTLHFFIYCLHNTYQHNQWDEKNKNTTQPAL